MPKDTQKANTGTTDNVVDLKGKLCPFAVMCIIKEVDSMQRGETRVFMVDDPLAIKSVPEELADYEAASVDVCKQEKGWEISVTLGVTD
ncbi:MAG: sulfurtransferase TusA family protein [Sedimenticola sp.]